MPPTKAPHGAPLSGVVEGPGCRKDHCALSKSDLALAASFPADILRPPLWLPAVSLCLQAFADPIFKTTFLFNDVRV